MVDGELCVHPACTGIYFRFYLFCDVLHMFSPNPQKHR